MEKNILRDIKTNRRCRLHGAKSDSKPFFEFGKDMVETKFYIYCFCIVLIGRIYYRLGQGFYCLSFVWCIKNKYYGHLY